MRALGALGLTKEGRMQDETEPKQMPPEPIREGAEADETPDPANEAPANTEPDSGKDEERSNTGP